MATPWALITVRGQHRCTYCGHQFRYLEKAYRQKLGSFPSFVYLYAHEQCAPKIDPTITLEPSCPPALKSPSPMPSPTSCEPPA